MIVHLNQKSVGKATVARRYSECFRYRDKPVRLRKHLNRLPRGRPKKTWKELVREDCQACKLNKEDAVDRCKWRKVIKEAR